MNIDDYLKRVTPEGILDVIEEPVLQNLLNGYSYALQSGITVLFPSGSKLMAGSIDRRNALAGNAVRSFSRVCAYWREAEGCNQEACCVEADNEIARNYFNGKWSKPRVFRCSPLRMWDMAYPLRVEARVVGVLFAGQIFLKQKAGKWRNGLAGLDIEIGEVRDDDQIAEMKGAILASTVPDSNKQHLKDLVEQDPMKEGVEVDGLRKRVEDFLRFGQITQGLLAELYQARKAAAEQELLKEFSQELAGVDLSNAAKGWDDYHHLLGQMLKLPDIIEVRLYVRNRSKFRYQGPRLQDDKGPEHLPARDAVPLIPAGSFVELAANSHACLLKRLAMGGDPIWAYRSERKAARDTFGSLLMLCGPAVERRRSFLQDLCGVVTTAADAASLSITQREADEAYRLKVNLIGHSFRTPLQALAFEIEDLSNAPAVAGSADLKLKAEAARARIMDAGEDLTMLLDSNQEEIESFDLLVTLEHVLETIAPIARKQPCKIEKQGDWPAGAIVLGNRYRLQRALTCLMDNAVKYSYAGERSTGSLFSVTVSTGILGGHVSIVLSNYGIGIAKETLDAIEEYGLEYGKRAEVVDEKRVRLGTGLGLRFAIDAIEDFGGWVHVRSVPAPKATPEDIEKLHRYVTTVEATLPMV